LVEYRGPSRALDVFDLDGDGKIKATPPLGRFAVVRQRVRAVPPERGWCRLSAKANGINANCATHRGFAGSGGKIAGRQGKSLAVPVAYVVGIIEVSGKPPERACQPFPPKYQ
jgi:hypothetical protein